MQQRLQQQRRCGRRGQGSKGMKRKQSDGGKGMKRKRSDEGNGIKDDEQCPRCAHIESIKARGSRIFLIRDAVGVVGHVCIGVGLSGVLFPNFFIVTVGACAYSVTRVIEAALDMKLSRMARQVSDAIKEHNEENQRAVQGMPIAMMEAMIRAAHASAAVGTAASAGGETPAGVASKNKTTN